MLSCSYMLTDVELKVAYAYCLFAYLMFDLKNGVRDG